MTNEQEKKITIFERMLKVQKAMPAIKKEKEGHNFKYAPLPTLLKEVEKIANKNGLWLSYTYVNNFNDPKVVQMKLKVSDIEGTTLEFESVPAIVSLSGRNNADESFGFGTKMQREVVQMAFGLIVEDESEEASDVTIGDPQIEVLREQINKMAELTGKTSAEIESDILYRYRVNKLEHLRGAQWGGETRALRDRINAYPAVEELKEVVKEYAKVKDGTFEEMESYIKNQSNVNDLHQLNEKSAKSWIKNLKKKMKE